MMSIVAVSERLEGLIRHSPVRSGSGRGMRSGSRRSRAVAVQCIRSAVQLYGKRFWRKKRTDLSALVWAGDVVCASCFSHVSWRCRSRVRR